MCIKSMFDCSVWPYTALSWFCSTFNLCLFCFDSQFSSSSRLFSFSGEDLTLDQHKPLSLCLSSIIFCLVQLTAAGLVCSPHGFLWRGKKRRVKVRVRDDWRMIHWVTDYSLFDRLEDWGMKKNIYSFVLFPVYFV